MGAKTITFTVQLGSSGFEIAREVAVRLCYQYYDWEVTSRAAAEAGVSREVVESAEHMPSLIERLLDRLFSAGLSGGEDSPIFYSPSSATIGSALGTMTSDDYRRFIEGAVVEIAKRGQAVVVGHASNAVLKDQNDILKVLVCGSLEKRAERLADEEGVTVKEAEARLRRSDQERTHFFKHFYHLNWLDASRYNLTIDTNRLPLGNATNLVLTSAKAIPNSSQDSCAGHD